ncbi:MiaB/RimO family radical SAM methylthiotransferase [Chloroflexota bacterium]
MKIHLDTIGCRLNQSEIETYARQFVEAGHELVETPAIADLTVINTCDVTAAAAADSRKKIRGAARAGSGEIVATGCWATLNPEATQTLPGVTHVVLNEGKDALVPKILQISPESFDLEPLIRQPVPGSRLRTRAFIKVQDGCDNRCTFCVTTLARGSGISIPVERILANVSAALAGGAHEIVLTGVHLGSWGRDFKNGSHLRDLVEIVLAETRITRLRLSSLEPWELDADFFTLWQDERLARHLHLPLQSGSAATLKRMARKTTPEEFSQLLKAARSQIPDVAITTDVITGFPGETEVEFDESLSYVRNMNFAGGHVFTYSERSGTTAAKMPNQVQHPVRKARNAAMRSIFEKTSEDYRGKFVGEQLSVLWETATPDANGGWMLSGLTDNYLRVVASVPQRIWNRISTVQLTGMRDGGMVGKIVNRY